MIPRDASTLKQGETFVFRGSIYTATSDARGQFDTYIDATTRSGTPTTLWIPKGAQVSVTERQEKP